MLKTKKQNLLFIVIFAAIVVAICIYMAVFSGQEKLAVLDTETHPTSYDNKSSQPNNAQSHDTLADGNATKSAAAELANQQPKIIVNRVDSTFKTDQGKTFKLRTYKPMSTNDPLGNQWWTVGTGLPTAWNMASGSKQTVVAVIDTGFALQHEEFTNRWAHNTGEQGATSDETPSRLNCTDRGLALDMSCNLLDDNFDGIVDNETGAATAENISQLNCSDRGLVLDRSCNLIDDDGNGYADDATGWDFINQDFSVQAGENNPDGDGVRHGTAVAGVIAASGDNNKGIAGVDWHTKILPLQALNDESYGNTLTVSQAVYYAADRGVDVINISLGSEEEDSYLRQAVQYAISKNVIVVASSGNDGCDCISYPGRYPEVVSVGAESNTGGPADFSSYGAELDVMAPGINITSPVWSKASPTSSYATNMAGTSFAAPYVSGLLSLARSHQPSAQWSELVNGLLATANHASLTPTNPFSTKIGSGYARANTFLNRVTTSAKPDIRYAFEPLPIKSPLSSSLAHLCVGSNDFPTAPLYEIKSASSSFYTIDQLERARAIERGDTVNYLMRTCLGLPHDKPSNLRLINLSREIKNIQDKTR